MGKGTNYVQITTDGKLYKWKSDSGKPYTDYHYKLAGFDEEGKEKEMEFNAQKNLRVHYSNNKGVTAWEEVKKEELPAKVKEKSGVKY